MDDPSNIENLIEKDFNLFIDSTHLAPPSQLAADFEPSSDILSPPLCRDGCGFLVDFQHLIKLTNDRCEESSLVGSFGCLFSSQPGNGR